MKNKVVLCSIVIILIIIGIIMSQTVFKPKEPDGSLPKETLLLQKDYIKEQLKKYNYDYKVVILIDENDYGILTVDMYKGDCKVVDDLILNSKAKIMETIATLPQTCNMVKK